MFDKKIICIEQQTGARGGGRREKGEREREREREREGVSGVRWRDSDCLAKKKPCINNGSHKKHRMKEKRSVAPVEKQFNSFEI